MDFTNSINNAVVPKTGAHLKALVVYAFLPKLFLSLNFSIFPFGDVNSVINVMCMQLHVKSGNVMLNYIFKEQTGGYLIL